MNSRKICVFALLSVVGTSASAGIFSWTGASDDFWSNHANWSGPGGQVPGTINDSATVASNTGEISIQNSLSLGSLSISNGASVLSAGNSVFVAGPVSITGVGSSLTVTETPAMRDLDVDTLSIQAGILAMYGGLAQIDDSMTIGQNGGILGTGTIEMNSMTGNLVLNSGSIWAMGGSGPSRDLVIRRTPSSTAKLDWTHPSGSLIVWDGKTIRNEMPYSGSLAGEIHISGFNGDAAFISTNGFITTPGSEIRMSGGPGKNARVEAPFIDAYGTLSIFADGTIDSPIVALRGSGTIAEGCRLTMSAGSTILHSFAFNAAGENASVSFTEPGSTMSVQSGASVFDLGETGKFDLDGSGDRVITIASGSSLSILAGAVDLGTELFSGTLNVVGNFHTESYNPQQAAWRSNGDIHMQGGTMTGRRFLSNGTISGRGLIDTMVHNDGLIEAIGGTLIFDQLDPGGTVEVPGAGVVRAEQGDISVTGLGLGGYLPTGGAIYVGNGVGIREVFEMNGGLFVGNFGDDAGLLSMNSGFARFGRLSIHSAFESVGNSVVSISGAGENDALEFSDGLANIDGTLEVRGNARMRPDAQFAGSGLIDSSSIAKRIDFMNGADTGSVAVAASGSIELGDNGQILAEAHIGGLTMRPTTMLKVDIAGDAASGDYDRLIISGSAAIDGTLVVRWSADLGDAPVGETYTVLTAGSVTGLFEAIDFSGLGNNRRASVSVHPDRVDVTVTCLMDLNADGVLDLSDINAFVEAFTGGDMLADVAPPMDVLDLNDVNAFVFFFQGGCN